MGLGVERSLEGREWKRLVVVERILLRMMSGLKLESSQSSLFLADQMHQIATGKIMDHGTLQGGRGRWWETIVVSQSEVVLQLRLVWVRELVSADQMGATRGQS